MNTGVPTTASSPARSPEGDDAYLPAARPLRAWRDAQKDALRQRFTELHRRWMSAWIAGSETSVTEPHVVVGDLMGEPTFVQGVGARWSFARAGLRQRPSTLPNARPDAALAVLEALFGADVQARAQVAHRAAQAAFTDWLARLDQALGDVRLRPRASAAEADGGALTDRWSGALRLTWDWCGGQWTLDLSHEAVAALLEENAGASALAGTPSFPPSTLQSVKVRLDQVLTDHSLPVRVLLRGTELTLGQLRGLQLNDIVPLNHPLDAPAQVVGTGGQAVCPGWLGQRNGRIALALTTPPDASALPRRAAPRNQTLKETT